MHSVYNPPNDQFVLPAASHRDLPHIVIGDFNSHSTSWGYDTTDNNGEEVEQWDSCDLTLIHDAKLRNPSTVQDGRKTTTQISYLHQVASRTLCKKSIMDPIPHTQHRPVCVSAHPVMVPHKLYLSDGRFNFIKADWNGYSAELDKLIEDVGPIPANCFVESVRVASRIPFDDGPI